MRSGLLTSRLPFPAILALRYLRSARRRASTTFLSAVAVLAIAAGVFALIVFLAALSGFQHVLRSDVLARTPDVEVELPHGTDAAGATRAARAARAVEGVAGVQQVVRGRGWMTRGGRVTPVELVGFAGELPRSFPGAERLPGGGEAAGAMPQVTRDDGLWLSRSLATSWLLEGGEVVDLISPRPTLTPMGPQPRVRSLPVVGVYEAGKISQQERAALPLEVVESLFGPGRRRLLASVEGGGDVSLRGSSGGASGVGAVARELERVLPEGSRISTWRELNRPLFFALRLERIFVFLGVSLIVLVAVLALLADLALIIANKRAEVGMLLTMGSTPARLRRAFVLLGGLLALSGTALGTGLGVGTAVVADRLGLVRLPGDVFLVEHVPFLVRPVDLALILVLTLALALSASLYGAHKAAALDPVEALRR